MSQGNKQAREFEREIAGEQMRQSGSTLFGFPVVISKEAGPARLEAERDRLFEAIRVRDEAEARGE